MICTLPPATKHANRNLTRHRSRWQLPPILRSSSTTTSMLLVCPRTALFQANEASVPPMLRSYKHINLPSDRVDPKTMSSLRAQSPTLRLPTNLPNEIFAQIAQYILGDALSDLDVTQHYTPSITKPPFWCIDGMTRASRRLRAIALPEWFRLFIVGRADDWIWASRLSGMHTWVRYIVCSTQALDRPAPVDVLSRFPYLRSASLSLASDYQIPQFLPTSSWVPGVPTEIISTLGVNYREPVTAFPASMTSLSIRAMHGSETPLLRNLGLQCPSLRTLRLGKCTMFESCRCADHDGGECGACSLGGPGGQLADGEQCGYWGTFPFLEDHEMYFGSGNVEAYAFDVSDAKLTHKILQDELAAELAPLQNLESVSFGVYLTPSAALTEHRFAHYPSRNVDVPVPAPLGAAPSTSSTSISLLSSSSASSASFNLSSASFSPSLSAIPAPTHTQVPFSTSHMVPPMYPHPALWSYDCAACRGAYAAPTEAAERGASIILAQTLPKLGRIEWASFFEVRGGNWEDTMRGRGRGRGTGTHAWSVVRDECGSVVGVERVFS
ncbi:hypothetical protein BDV93DRAFT_611419 [Ceratobasidium sp. AG-I]|nr:hypothetical protein BDV93DRAFT_611419 [Ceratobasidium sp. AG-I]